ncbi:TPA: hypothetical protein K8J16_001156 [Serratia marcescens]|uniref:hypothetical protein n=1 Tax=Serratia marcescens TaxID=615 RepID=UPI001C76804A|nr:hypothetical protein [Serratia marcescens]BCZ39811.1 hypothetical protein SMGES_11370 [Serratia marcescens]HBI6266457.1 hypothetical protein [Serratia marcescens]HBI6947654.1 hypothetical protein [Serratia marcescens]
MDKLREEFEQWFSTREKAMKSQGLGLISISRLKSRQWEAWQASRASIVVELPSKSFYFGDNDLLKGAVSMVADRQESRFIESLRSIGLSIKGE